MHVTIEVSLIWTSRIVFPGKPQITLLDEMPLYKVNNDNFENDSYIPAPANRLFEDPTTGTSCHTCCQSGPVIYSILIYDPSISFSFSPFSLGRVAWFARLRSPQESAMARLKGHRPSKGWTGSSKRWPVTRQCLKDVMFGTTHPWRLRVLCSICLMTRWLKWNSTLVGSCYLNWEALSIHPCEFGDCIIHVYYSISFDYCPRFYLVDLNTVSRCFKYIWKMAWNSTANPTMQCNHTYSILQLQSWYIPLGKQKKQQPKAWPCYESVAEGEPFGSPYRSYR